MAICLCEIQDGAFYIAVQLHKHNNSRYTHACDAGGSHEQYRLVKIMCSSTACFSLYIRRILSFIYLLTLPKSYTFSSIFF